MTTLSVLTLSMIIQIVAVVFVVMSIAKGKDHMARVLLAGALTLMASRRIVSALLIMSNKTLAMHSATGPEWIALTISCLMCACGFCLIRDA